MRSLRISEFSISVMAASAAPDLPSELKVGAYADARIQEILGLEAIVSE